MGKTTTSCFKVIACGGDSVDHDDLQTSESKGSSDRRGWSFRKRSMRQRILSNSVISESPSSINKENPERTVINEQVQPGLSLPEKTSVIQGTEDKDVLSTQLGLKLSDTKTAKDDDCGANVAFDESSVVIIQSAIRGFVAQQILLKQKSVIKLQAAARGHSVRRHAIGTLRCVLAIIKMQAHVRARYARLAPVDASRGTNKNDPPFLGKTEAKPISLYRYISIEKLLSNAFARQLMESTPRNEPINIKCEPSKSDSAWKWLERWMSVSSMTKERTEESGSVAETIRHSDDKECISIPSDYHAEPANFISIAALPAEASVDDGQLISCDAKNSSPILFTSISPSSSHAELVETCPTETRETDLIEEVEVRSLPQEEINEQNLVKISSEKLETDPKKISRKASNPTFLAAQSKFEELSSAATSMKLSTPFNHDTGVESSLDKASSSEDQPFRSMDNELGGNTVCDTPAIHNGGSECETELSISSTLDSPERPEAKVDDIEQEPTVSDKVGHIRSGESLEVEINGKSRVLETDPSYSNSNNLERDETIELSNSTVALEPPQIEKKLEADPVDLQVALGSEGSHPINKSSSEASPSSHIIASESQATPSSQVSAKPKKQKGERKSESNLKNKLSSSADKKSLSSLNRDKTDPLHRNSSNLERDETIELSNSTVALEPPQIEKKLEADPVDLQVALGSEGSHPVNKSSSKASPSSHITDPESQATPSSQVSAKPKKQKGERKSESNLKNKLSSSTDKKSLSTLNRDSASRGSLEQLQENKTGKRSSFGSAKPDYREQEPRESSSNNTLPSYMQATESARAKAIASGSPRSSPDVQEKDIYVQKRHSLPGLYERQGSPRIQRSQSLAQQNAKGNDTNSPQERRWCR